MAKRKKKYPIPGTGVVRATGVVLLSIDILLMTVAVMNYQVLGWTAYAIFFGSAATIYFPIKAIQTGDPEWILLDLILPG